MYISARIAQFEAFLATCTKNVYCMNKLFMAMSLVSSIKAIMLLNALK